VDRTDEATTAVTAVLDLPLLTYLTEARYAHVNT
jgi:hypothetical protein